MLNIYRIDNLNPCDREYTTIRIMRSGSILTDDVNIDRTYLSINRKLVNKIQIKKVGLVYLAIVDILSIYTKETKDHWCFLHQDGNLIQRKLNPKLTKEWWGCFVFIHYD